MTKTIWKFEFKVDDEVALRMPFGTRVLSVGSQCSNHICVWALVNPKADLVEYTFHVRGTGHPIEQAILLRAPLIGTVMDGVYVWHVFGPDRGRTLGSDKILEEVDEFYRHLHLAYDEVIRLEEDPLRKAYLRTLLARLEDDHK